MEDAAAPAIAWACASFSVSAITLSGGMISRERVRAAAACREDSAAATRVAVPLYGASKEGCDEHRQEGLVRR